MNVLKWPVSIYFSTGSILNWPISFLSGAITEHSGTTTKHAETITEHLPTISVRKPLVTVHFSPMSFSKWATTFLPRPITVHSLPKSVLWQPDAGDNGKK